MKKTNLLLLVTLLSSSLLAKNINLLESPSSVGKSIKKSIPLDINYTTEHVSIGETSEVKILLSTSLTSGTLTVTLLALENDIIGIVNSKFTFEITKEKQSFPINLELSSSTNGRHYLDIHTNIKNRGSRVFVVPFNVGIIKKKSLSKVIHKTDTKELLSISSAEEVIK